MREQEIRHFWTAFELLPGQTHEKARQWFYARGYRNGNYNADSRIHRLNLDGLAETKLQALLAKADCPVKYPASEQAMFVHREAGGSLMFPG